MSNRTVLIFVNTQFIGFHRWLGAPDSHKFLREWHLHVFHVRFMVEVVGLDRSIEFIKLKEELDIFLRKYNHQHFESSCEMIAEDILSSFYVKGDCCTVSEDGENGAIVITKKVPVTVLHETELTVERK